MSILHKLIIGIIIVVIIVLQIIYFCQAIKKRKEFEIIFPEKPDKKWGVQKNNSVQIVSLKDIACQKALSEEDKLKSEKLKIERRLQEVRDFLSSSTIETEITLVYRNREKTLLSDLSKVKQELEEKQRETSQLLVALEDEYSNKIIEEIVTSINRYLEKNKDGVTDFNLIRDIIDRNCDAVDEEINTLQPIPLYLGLIGTMSGILVGVFFLTFTGSLGSLLDANATYDLQATKGIEALFGGIASAMISSIIGILFTTIGSVLNKNTKAKVEKNKHTFISWLQSELLPKISTELSSALISLGRDINNFNSKFVSNANALQHTIEKINDSTIAQSEIFKSIKQLDIVKISEANIVVYEKLKSCTDDIASLAEDLHSVEESIRGVGNFMENGINEYEKRNSYILDASGKVDIAVKESEDKLSKSATEIFEKYNELLNTLYMKADSTTKELAKKYDVEADKLHRVIVEKLTDFKQLENELKNLVAVKTSMLNLEKATSEQNKKIDSLAKSIQELANVKATGGVTNVEMKMPKLFKFISILSGVVVIIIGLFLIALFVIEFFGIR